MWNPFREDKANWVIVLETMYENQISISDKPTGQGESDTIMKNFGLYVGIPLPPEEVAKSLNYLEETGFVKNKNDDPDNKIFGLTQEGLQLAHQIKNERQRQRTNRILILLSAILVLPLLFDFWNWYVGIFW